MPVTTINLKDFLTQKKAGDIVTAEDWNKLVALFDVINYNANALLDLSKAVDANASNIAGITLGAVPEGSISSEQLSKAGGTTTMFKLTEDATPQEGVTYYVRNEQSQYVPAADIADGFEPGVEYFNNITVATEAAVNRTDVIADGIINAKHIIPGAVLERLLTDDITIITDAKQTIEFTNLDEYMDIIKDSTIKTEYDQLTNSRFKYLGALGVAGYKAVIIFNGDGSCCILFADPEKPDIFFNWNGVSYQYGAAKADGSLETLVNKKYYTYGDKTVLAGADKVGTALFKASNLLTSGCWYNGEQVCFNVVHLPTTYYDTTTKFRYAATTTTIFDLVICL